MKFALFLIGVQLAFGVLSSSDFIGIDFQRSLYEGRPTGQLSKAIKISGQNDRELVQQRPYTIESLFVEVRQFTTDLGYVANLANGVIYVTKAFRGQNVFFFACAIEVSKNNAIKLNRSYIVCSNRPIPGQPQFARYKRHHGIYRRAITNANAAAQTAYIKLAIDKLLAISNKVLNPPTVDDVYNYIGKVIADEKIEDVIIKDKFKIDRCLSFDVLTKEAQDKLYQVIVFTIDQNYIGVDLSINDKTHLLIVSRMNVESIKDDLKTILTTKPAENELKRLETSDSSLEVKTYVGENCKTDVPTFNILKTGPSYNILQIDRPMTPVPAKPEEVCFFGGTKTITIGFHYGYMQYFHIIFDSKQFTYESAIILKKDKFKEKLTAVLALVKETGDGIIKAQADSTMEVLVTYDALKKVMEEAFAEPPKDAVFNENEKAYYASKKIIPIGKLNFATAKIDVKVLNNADGYIIKMNKMSGEGYTPVYGEITLPSINGYDYKESLKKHLADFLKKAQEAPAGGATGG